MSDEQYLTQRNGQESTTTDGKPPAPGMENAGAPQPIDPKTGQHGAYYVLSEAERAKGWVRPYRDTYKHVGIRPKYPLRDLTPEETAQHGTFYAKFEPYPESERPVTGRYWTLADLETGCGQSTTMGRALSETYARDPSYYGSTFCSSCGKHFPVEEFVWKGSDARVGS